VKRDIGFRVAIVILLAAMTTIRSRAHRQALKSRGESVEFEGRLNIALRILGALSLFSALIAYVINPDWLAWAALPLPSWLRWLGAPTGVAGLAGLFWVHRELGQNFSGTLHLRTDHELVISGPYRWVRHPMYTVFYLLGLSILLLSANWLLGGGTLVALSMVMLSRLVHEEAVMEERFGDQYRDYMTRTGRFFPRLRA
jgi:protein-S-isoprenylcysteine O-methyltransferase Ste14